MANIGDRLLLYLFPSFQHPGVLADPCHVFHHPLLHHYEETDQGSDHFRVQLDAFSLSILVWNILPSDCFPLQHMIRFRYLPFTWGKPKFQVSWAQYFLLHPWPFPTDQQTNLTIFGQTKTMFCLSHSLLRESEEVGEGKAPLLQQSAWSQADDFSQGAADKLIWSWCQWSAHQLPVVETGQMW